MWGPLRVVLLIGNAVLLALFVYYVGPHFTDPEQEQSTAQYLVASGSLIFLVLNLVYLLQGKQGPSWRVFRLIGLWFDAKEGELRQRADRSRQDK